jgi:phage terminase large subunit-like protein
VIDYTVRAIEYALHATDKANRRSYGNWTILAAKRFLGDLKRAKAKKPPFYFSVSQANKACAFVEQLPHVEGVWDTPNIVLHASDIFFICQLFGFRKEDGTRRYTTALKATARKNAKSTICAAIALYCQTMEREIGPQIIAAATTGDQARIVFKIAKRMVEKTQALREAFGLEPFANAIASFSNGGTFKAISAKASTQDGLNPSCLILDEIHAHKNSELLDVLRSAAGARRSPLFLYATTEGYESPGPWHELRDMAKKVLSGKLKADHFLAVYYAIDDDDDEFDESCWIKANPLMDVNPILLTEIRKEAIEAKAMPGKMAEFRIKRMNRQSATAQGWINFDKWKKCGGKVDLEYLKGFPCYGGLDLASTTDLCSFRLVWYVNGVYYTWGRRWVPEEAVKTRTVRGSVPYQSWVESGYIEQTKGDVIDHNVIAAAIIEANERFDIRGIGYDQWNAAQLVAKLEAENVPMQMFIQGPKSYHPAMQEFERAYISGNFRYGHDPVLTWNASNIITRTDQNMNTAPDKKKSPDKIDDMVSLLMAFGVANKTQEASIDDFINNPVIC